MQSVAGFASLHCAITLLLALIVQYTLRSRSREWVGWVNFALTVVATIYFGWHYLADDLAGIVIAIIGFYLGGIASGQKFDRRGPPRSPRRPPPQCRSGPELTGSSYALARVPPARSAVVHPDLVPHVSRSSARTERRPAASVRSRFAVQRAVT